VARKLLKKKVRHELMGMRHRVPIESRRMMKKALAERGPFQLKVSREPENAKDYWALKVTIREAGNPYDKIHIGYVPRKAAEVYAPLLDKGEIKIKDAWLMSLDPEDGEAEIMLNLRVPLKMKGRKTGQPSRKRVT
jgi:hypothetical protein